MARINWRGTQVAERATWASALAIDQTTAAAVNHAKQNHPWQNVTGTLEGSLRMEPARLQGGELIGQWGSFDVLYALWQEIGTEFMDPNPYLRPAADATYPALHGRIRANFEGMP